VLFRSVADVRQSLKLMLKQLLEQLKGDLQFPTCLKVIGLIRRLDVFTETQLRIKFLQLRDMWFRRNLDNIARDDAYGFISKTVDEYRVNLFDIITQYKALFSDEDLNMSLITASMLRDQAEAKVFNFWILDKITSFINTLRESLKSDGVKGRFDNIVNQAMYFGLAYSRIGLDFRLLLTELFEEFAFEQLKDSIVNANSRFDDSLARFNLSEALLMDSSLSLNTGSVAKDCLHPPLCLMEFHPLAVYLNSLLQGLNDFRLCAPLNLAVPVKEEIENSLEKVAKALAHFIKSQQNMMDKNEKELGDKMLHRYVYDLVPHVQLCFMTVFPIKQIQNVLAIKQNDLETFKEFLKLDDTKTFSCVGEFVKVDTDVIDIKLYQSANPGTKLLLNSSDTEKQNSTDQLSLVREESSEPKRDSDVQLQEDFNEQKKEDEAPQDIPVVQVEAEENTDVKFSI